MISTDVLVLMRLWASAATKDRPATPVSIADLVSWTNDAGDLPAVLDTLVSLGVVQAHADGVSFGLGPQETGDSLLVRASTSGLSLEQLSELQELFAGSGLVTPAGDPFRDASRAAGVGPVDAAFGGLAARVVALQRLRRTGAGDLLGAAQRSCRLGAVAQAHLGD